MLSVNRESPMHNSPLINADVILGKFDQTKLFIVFLLIGLSLYEPMLIDLVHRSCWLLICEAFN